MNEIQDIKEVFSPWEWEKRVGEDRKRIYGFLLCTDEHEMFLKFIQRAWRTLDALSGKTCDIFTLERWEFPHDRFKSNCYLPIEGGRRGLARIARGDEYGFPGQDIAIDNGLMLPERTQCLKVKEMLFEKPNNIILPGFAVFASAYTKEAVYYNCSNLDNDQLSESFQHILTSVKEAYNSHDDRLEIFEYFKNIEFFRKIKERLTKELLTITLKDIYSILSGGLKIVMPKLK